VASEGIVFSACPLVRSSDCYQTVEHDILNTNDQILMPTGKVVHGQGRVTLNSWGQEIKGQGHARPKIELEAWRRHHSVPL